MPKSIENKKKQNLLASIDIESTAAEADVLYSKYITDSYVINNKGEKITDTQWHNIVAWGKTAQIIEKYVTKGKEVAIEGKLTSRSYETKEGEKRYITEVVCNELMMLGNK